MTDTLLCQYRVFEVPEGDNVVLVSNCHTNFLNTIFGINHIFVVSIQQIISLECYLKIDHRLKAHCHPQISCGNKYRMFALKIFTQVLSFFSIKPVLTI